LELASTSCSSCTPDGPQPSAAVRRDQRNLLDLPPLISMVRFLVGF
jgi:hypothetical protein